MNSLSNIALSKSAISRPQAKSSSNIFHFHKELIQQPLENLDQLVYTKKRYLDFLKLPSDLTPDFYEAHLSQSFNLSSLNQRILSLKYKISKILKSAKKKFAQQKILAIKAKILTTQKECENLIIKQIELTQDLKKQKDKNLLEMKNSEQKLKTFEEIADVLREDKMLKDEELNETKKDLEEIQKIYEGMNEIFSSVQEKLDEKRKEVNDLNFKCFGLVMETEDAQELDRAYRETCVEGGMKKELKGKMKKKYKKVKDLNENILGFEEGATQLCHKLQGIEDSISAQDLYNVLTEASKDIQILKKKLDLSLPKPLKILQNNESKSIDGQSLNKTLKSTLDSLVAQINEIDLNSSSQLLISQLSLLNSQDYNNQLTISSLQSEICSLSTKNSSILESIKPLSYSIKSCDFSIYLFNSKLETLENKLSNEFSVKKSEINTQEELKHELIALQKKLNKTQNLKNIHQNMKIVHGSPDSRKMKNVMNQVTILHEELIKKDSVIIKKNWEILKVSKEIKELQKQVEEWNEKELKLKQEAFFKVNGEIDRKNKEIEMLKEILKGNASEIKAKDSKVNIIRKKVEGLSLAKLKK